MRRIHPSVEVWHAGDKLRKLCYLHHDNCRSHVSLIVLKKLNLICHAVMLDTQVAAAGPYTRQQSCYLLVCCATHQGQGRSHPAVPTAEVQTAMFTSMRMPATAKEAFCECSPLLIRTSRPPIKLACSHVKSGVSLIGLPKQRNRQQHLSPKFHRVPLLQQHSGNPSLWSSHQQQQTPPLPASRSRQQRPEVSVLIST